MQATITYCLTEAAQRAQMAATGQPVSRRQTVPEDIPVAPWLTHLLVSVDKDGLVTADLDRTWGINEQGDIGGYPQTGVVYGELNAQPASGVEALETVAARIAAKQEECKANYAVRQVELVTRRETERVQSEAREAKGREVRDEASRRRNADAAIEAEKEAAKQEYIVTWIAALLAYPSVQQQFADGLLCRKDAVQLIADAAFAAAGVGDAFKCAEFCDVSECKCGESVIDCLPRSKYPAWQAIKAGLPEGYQVEFSRYRECLRAGMDRAGWCSEDGATAGAAQHLAKITIPHGPFKFTRTVEL